ncbi:Glycosyltransferase AglE [Candidatus Tiddalikarchaeum anstoanum]|nr:Glycosyltransferase AglE [Candidatus Tiddalikarchaeum anstoanum]
MKVSIIIPTFGRPKIFEKCIKSIEVLDLNPIKPFEVVVINNNNDKKLRDETSRVCRDSKLNIVEIKTESAVGSVKARNLGIKKARGEILFFFDDDTEIQKDYFKYIMRDYCDVNVGAAGGSEIKEKISLLHRLFFAFNKPGSITWSGEIISNFSPDYKNKIIVEHLHGSNFSIRRSVIKKIGLMDEKMEGHYRDETEFVYRVFESGFDVVFEPKARVFHNASSIGGNIDPSRKKDWAYWYHRNTSYFFFKHLYKNNAVRLFFYLLRELIMSIIRSVIYMNIYYLTEIKGIVEGYNLNLRTIKSKSI